LFILGSDRRFFGPDQLAGGHHGLQSADCLRAMSRKLVDAFLS